MSSAIDTHGLGSVTLELVFLFSSSRASHGYTLCLQKTSLASLCCGMWPLIFSNFFFPQLNSYWWFDSLQPCPSKSCQSVSKNPYKVSRVSPKILMFTLESTILLCESRVPIGNRVFLISTWILLLGWSMIDCPKKSYWGRKTIVW
jgi:hypothetical protein